MIDGQTSPSLERDYDWPDRLEAASYADIEDPWTQSMPTRIAASRPAVAMDAGTDELRALIARWSEFNFEVDEAAIHKWQRTHAYTGATSPLRLFVRQLDEKTSFDTLLAYVRYGLGRDHGNRIADRLSELRNDLADDEETSNLSMASALGLVRFLADNPKVRDPSLVATNAGNLRAEWHVSWSQHFVIEFTSDADARFVIFIEDNRSKGKKVRISGTCSVASVMEQAHPHGVDSWVMR